MSDSDLYGDDIRLWSERQAALLRRLAAGEAVSEQVDWPHVVEEIEDLGHGDAHPPVQDEIAQLTARLAAAEALVKELRARLDSLTGKLADTQAELASTQDQVETATARAAAVEAEQAMRVARRGQGRWARLGPRGEEGLGDAQLAPGNSCGRRCHCPGHVGLQHTRLDRDEVADDWQAGGRGGGASDEPTAA